VRWCVLVEGWTGECSEGGGMVSAVSGVAW
jgi:hypothetical protein